MKKLLSVLLTLALLLGCASGLAEETAEKQILGSIRVNGEFTLKATLPEGYRVVPFEQSDDMMMLRIVSKDNTKPQMAMFIAFDETYANVDRLSTLLRTSFRQELRPRTEVPAQRLVWRDCLRTEGRP